MDLRQLEMLLAVFDCGSYAKAGERLRVSHSAIHRQIRLLEHEVQDRIVIRTGRRAELTEIGEILLNLSRRVRQEITAAEREIAERKQLHSGHLSIGTGTTMLVFFLPAILECFRKQHPGVDVHVITSTADHVLEEIQKGTLDVGLIFASRDMPAPGHALVSEVLFREEFVVAVGKDHPLAEYDCVPLERVVEHPFITHSRSSHVRRVLERLCARAGVVPTISMELENEEAMEKMIEINMGIALLSIRRAMSDSFRYVRVQGAPIFCDVCLVYANAEYTPRAVKEFNRLCRSFRSAQAGGLGSTTVVNGTAAKSTVQE